MKQLTTTNEMQKFQEAARQTWQEKKSIDAAAVVLGWNLHKGSVIVDTAKGFEFELQADPASYGYDDSIDIIATINGENKAIKFTKRQIASIILQQPCTVYYSR